jgi:hypothetical protein
MRKQNFYPIIALIITSILATFVVASLDLEVTINASDVIQDGQVDLDNEPPRATDVSLYVCGENQGGCDGDYETVSYVEFNTSEIPDTTTITDVQYKINFQFVASSGDIGIRPIQVEVVSQSDANLFSDIRNGTAYASSTISSTGWKTFDLGSQADTDLQNLLSSDWFAVGNDPDDIQAVIDASDDGSNKSPQLVVTYTEAASAPYPNQTHVYTNTSGTNNTGTMFTYNVAWLAQTGYGMDWSLISENQTGSWVNYTKNYTWENINPYNISSLNFWLTEAVGTRFKLLMFANDTAGIVNNTIDLWITIIDSIKPTLDIISPTNVTYTEANVDFNISSNETLDSCVYTISSWTNNYTMTSYNNTWFNYTNSSMEDGGYIVQYWCNDTSNNFNTSNQLTFTVDAEPPILTALLPQNITYSVADLYFNVSSNKPLSSCVYTIGDWDDNTSMASLNTTVYWAQRTNMDNSSYTAMYWCNATNTHTANTSVIFRVDVPRTSAVTGASRVLLRSILAVLLALYIIIYFIYPIVNAHNLKWDAKAWITFFVVGLITVVMIIVLIEQIFYVIV